MMMMKRQWTKKMMDMERINETGTEIETQEEAKKKKKEDGVGEQLMIVDDDVNDAAQMDKRR